MKVHLLSGFLGSGKTTAIQQAASILLQQGKRIGVITNDQGIHLVDSNFFRSLNIPNRQVVNGCFCCNYEELNNSIESLVETTQPDIIFAESVGSCTDIVATVMKPLLRYRKNIEVTVSTFADARLLQMMLKESLGSFDETVKYIYYKQLEEAGIIIVNKIDLMNTADLEELRLLVDKKYGNKKLIFQNSLNIHSLSQWLTSLNEPVPANQLPSLEIDYDIYGTGEAKLAWLDQELEIFNSTTSASQDAVDIMNLVYEKITTQHFSIAHLKFLLNEKTKISFTSTSQAGTVYTWEGDPSSRATLLINARVQTTPEILSGLLSEALEELKNRTGCSIITNSVSAFQPGFPRPTHRIAD